MQKKKHRAISKIHKNTVTQLHFKIKD